MRTMESGRRGERRRMIRMTAAVLLMSILLISAVTEPTWAATHSFRTTTINVNGTRTAKFTCNGMTGLCCKAGAHSESSGKASLSRMKNTSNAARCAYYYGYQKGWTSGSNGHKLARLLSYCMGNGTNGEFKTSTMKSLLKTAQKVSVPDGFECWLCKPKGKSKQDFIVWRYPKGKLKVWKVSADTALSNSGTYSLAGITIRVYSDAACKTCVKTLTTKKDGSTGDAFSLHVGTYYVKEAAVPANTGYQLNGTVYKVKVTSASAAAKVSVANRPDTGSVSVEKVLTGDGGSVEGFRFVLSGPAGRKYTMVTGAGGTAKVTGLPFGKYTLKEELNPEQKKYYTDRTGVQTFTLSRGEKTQHLTLRRTNHYENRQQLKILKETGDDGSPGGFRFLVCWKLADQKTISAEDIVKEAVPQITLKEGQNAGIWQIADPAQVEAINNAARKGETGRFAVELHNTVTGPAQQEEGSEDERQEPENEQSDPKDEHAGPEDRQAEDETALSPTRLTEEVRISVGVELTGLRETSLTQTGEASGEVAAAEFREVSFGSYTVQYRDISFQGAATVGEEEVETDASGQYCAPQVRPGTYTVTERMTERQKMRYRTPQTQEKILQKGMQESLVFSFENKPIRIPVRLRKASTDREIGNIEFTLTGTPAFAKEPMEDIVVRTDAAGIADFGMLYPGNYILEESEFDAARYANGYRMEGRDVPAFAFTITGEELTEKQIEGGACLWLGGEPQKGGISADETTFRNVPYVDLWLTKVDGVTRGFLPGAEFSLRDEDNALAARFRIDADADGMPIPVVLQTNGIVTAQAAEETADKSVVVIGAQEQEAERDYPCIVLHGLMEGHRYTLTEEVAPEGFASLENPYIFTVTLDDQGEPSLNTCDEYGETITTSARRGTLVVVNHEPSIGTVALDRATEDHIADAAESVFLTDTCRVSNLEEGRTYTLVARLMDTTAYVDGGSEKDVTQVRIGGTPVMGLITFTADAREHTVRVPLKLDGSALAGRSTVVYEALYTGVVTAAEADQKEAVAEESDPGNRSQTVVFPRVGTRAEQVSTRTIEDRVDYRNLLPGRTYCMQGRLIDRASGKTIEDGLAEKTFRADPGGSGSVIVKFKIDAHALAEQGITDLVVFEKCLLKGAPDERGESRMTQVASHEDINDEAQWVTIDTVNPPGTGDPFWMSAFAAMAAALATGTVLICRRCRKGLR